MSELILDCGKQSELRHRSLELVSYAYIIP